MSCDESKNCCNIDSTVNIVSALDAGVYQAEFNDPNITLLINSTENLMSFLIGFVNASCTCAESKLRIINSLNTNYNAFITSIAGLSGQGAPLIYDYYNVGLQAFITGFYQIYYAYSTCSCASIPFTSATLYIYIGILNEYNEDSQEIRDDYAIFEESPDYTYLQTILLNPLIIIGQGFIFPPDQINNRTLVLKYANFLKTITIV